MSSDTSKELMKVEQRDGFSKTDLQKVQEHLDKVGPVTLPPHVAEKMFETYIGGSSLAEVSKYNSEYSQGSIYYTAYKLCWPQIRDEICVELQSRIKQKVLHSKYQQLELVGTMIQVAHIEAMNAMYTYLKHPNDKNLPKTLRIKSIRDLSIAIEMMANIIGQNQHKQIDIVGSILTKTEAPSNAKNVSVDGALSEITAKALLKAMNKKDPEPEVIVDAEVEK